MINTIQTLFSKSANKLKCTNIKNKIDDIFQGVEIDKNAFTQLLLDLKDKEMIEYFCICLNSKRCEGKFELTKGSFVQLKEIMEYILKNVTNIEDNYEYIKYCLILAQTYYYLNGDKKIYINTSFKHIAMLKQREFWEYFFAKNFSDELLNMKNKSKTNKNNNVFSKVLTLVHNMIDVKVQKIIIKDIACLLCKQYELDKRMNKEVMMLIESYKDEDSVQLCLEKDDVNEVEEI